MLSAIPSSIPVCITGASSGFGEEFARQFAERGHDVTLVARRVDRLKRLAKEVRKDFGVTATPLEADLQTTEGRGAVASVLREGGPWLLINNAGFGTHGRFAELDAQREVDETTLNVVAVTELAAAVLPGCVEVGEGGLINVASTAAFQPLPYMATYAATKAFVLHFTEALAVELRGTGVRIQALCPGPAKTEFGDVAGNAREIDRLRPMTADRVVAASLKAFDKNRTICVPGTLNAVGANTVRLAPRTVVRRVAGPIFKPR